jgi:hypothetical protein
VVRGEDPARGGMLRQRGVDGHRGCESRFHGGAILRR